MSDTDHAACPRCGRSRPTEAPAGLCPRCRLEGGLDSGGEVTDSFDSAQLGRVLETLAATLGPVSRIFLPDTAGGAGEPQPLVNPSSPEMPPLADRPVRVQLLGEIARGGMGVVLKGRDPDLGRDLAVKVLLESHMEKPDLVRRFVEEAQISGQLQHPGIVPVYELGTFGDCRPYFTMKLVKGQTLAELLSERESPADDLPRFLGIFEQICQTMAYAHARDVIHRDLKPSNVMVGSFGEVQVMDWGLAKVLPKGGVVDDAAAGRMPVNATVIATAWVGSDSDLSQAGSVLGTPAYMAPEQARGEIDVVSERADVFALGSILCEILTGRPAFAGRSSGEIHRKAALGDLAEALAALEGKSTEPELIALTRDCLAREPEDRPRHAGAVAERITAYRADVQERLRTVEIARATEEARAEEEAKRRVLADELAREAQARAEESRIRAEVAQAKSRAERQARRLTGALAAAVLGLVVAVGGGYTWFQWQRSARQAQVDLALREAEVMRASALQAGDDLVRWLAAREAARAVERLLGDARDQATRQRVRVLLESVTAAAQTAENDHTLLDKLIDIRSAKEDDPDGSDSDLAYAAAFREAGIDVAAVPPAEAGNRVKTRSTAIAVTLSAALDNWAAVRRSRRRDRPGAERLAQAARAADADPWRNQLRDALEASKGPQRLEELRGLARTAKVDLLPAVSLDLLGSALGDAGDPQLAEGVLRRAQRRSPGDVWLNYDLADCLEKLGRREEAIRYYTAARSIRPEVAHELAHALEEKGESDEAIAIFQELTRLRPGNGRHLMCLGRALQAAGRTRDADVVLDSAIAAMRAQLRQRPDDARTHANLGNTLRDQGKLDEAIAEYRECLRLQPDYASALVSWGIVLCDHKHEYEAAAAKFREAIRLQPDYANAHDCLGVALRNQGKWDLAIAEHREAIQLQPSKASSHNQLGWTLKMQGKLAEALAEFREAIRIEPDDVTVRDSLGTTLRSLGKLAEAIAEYHEAMRLQPDSAVLRNGLAWTVVLMPKRPPPEYAEALLHSRRAVELAPKEVYMVNTLALAEYRTGHWAESITASERAIALAKEVDASNWFFLAMANWQRGEKDTAREWFDKAVAWTKEKDPKNAELLLFWTESAELLGQPGPDAPGPSSPAAPSRPKSN
jgi:eukaryotic-like serine/threonine-protein kinase